jgi:hypothetical protein
VNVQKGHTKGHQNEKGTVIGSGLFQSAFTWESFEGEWIDLLHQKVFKMQNQIHDQLQGRTLNEDTLILDIHKIVIQDFYKRLGGAVNFSSHSTCFCCLREMPEHPLPCGHVLCSECISGYGSRVSGNMVLMEACPLHSLDRFSRPWHIRFKPEMAGIRILSLDGQVYAYPPVFLFD